MRPLFNHTSDETPLTYRRAFVIGLYQCIAALLPGTSRSMATIVGGMQQRLSRKHAAEFSFFLAVPTMFGATLKEIYDLVKDGAPKYLTAGNNLTVLLLGNVVAFVVGLVAVKYFIHYITRYGFRAFGWYRIAVGLLILLLPFCGVSLKPNTNTSNRRRKRHQTPQPARKTPQLPPHEFPVRTNPCLRQTAWPHFFQLVAKVRWLLTQAMGGTKLKVGHAGTLDPLASGVMIVCTGRATKKIDTLQAGVKEYVATLRLGATTPSFDLEHPIDATYPTSHIDRALVETTLKQLLGDIMQVPPAFSACKSAGAAPTKWRAKAKKCR